MSGVRLTMIARNTDGVKAKMRARTARQKARLLAASVSEAETTFDLAQALCPRDTHYMAAHMRLEFTRGGFNWLVVFRREDFVGQVNDQAPVPFTITEFYPVFVTEGTRHMAGNDFLQAALRMRRAQILTAYGRALKG